MSTLTDEEIIAVLSKSAETIERNSKLFIAVAEQSKAIMADCHARDCGYSDANKDCEQHSRCAQCLQRWMVKV